MQFAHFRVLTLVSIVTAFAFSSARAASQLALKSGAPLRVERDDSSPRVTLVLTFPGGPGVIAPEQQGLAFVLKEMLNEGPVGMSGDAFRDALFLATSEVDFLPARLAMNVVVKAPADRLKETLALVDKILAAPKLDDVTFSRAKEKVVAQTAARFDSMRNVVFYFGLRDATKNHPFVLDGNGSPKSLSNVTLQDVKAKFPELLNGKLAFFSAVGPVEQSAVATALEQSLGASPRFSDYVPFKSLSVSPEVFKRKSLAVKIIDMPGATDNQIFYVYPEQIKMDSPEAAVAGVAHGILGGGLSGRLGKKLRTERGLTYHASSIFNPVGWSVYTFGGVEQTPKLLIGVPEVITSFKKEKLSERDIAEAQGAKSTEFKESVELPMDRLMAKLSLTLRGLDPSFVDKYQSYLAATTTKSIKDFVNKKVTIDGGYLYLMGDAKNLSQAVKEAGIDSKSVTVVPASEIL
jgi:zinc protease